MAQVNAYLTFNGNCEEAFEFYRSVFGGEFQHLGRFGDMPAPDGQEMPAEIRHRIMHVALPISQETILMGSDTNDAYGGSFAAGNSIALSVNTDSKEEADRIFTGLSADGKITMPLAETFWGAYFGMWTDKFGIHWMVNYDDPSKSQH